MLEEDRVTFSVDWNLFYEQGATTGTYPIFEKLVIISVSEAERMLEIGAGGGGEIPFFLSRGFGYHGVDGSDVCIADLRKRFPSISSRLRCADFTKELGFDGKFDLIVDRASIPHNDEASIRRCVALIAESLKPGGIFISCDWFSTSHSEVQRGVVVDALQPKGNLYGTTRTAYEDGQFRDVGMVHFSSEQEIVDLFDGFEGIFMQERIARRPAPNRLIERPLAFPHTSAAFRHDIYQSAVWDVVVRKPA